MIIELTDFYRGDTKRWSVHSETNIAGASIAFQMAKSLTQEVADLQVLGVLDAPDELGAVYNATLSIPVALSVALEPGEYFAQHRMILAEEATTFLPQKITVLRGVPAA